MLKSDENMDEKLYNELLEKENMGEYRKMLVGLPSQTADNISLFTNLVFKIAFVMYLIMLI